MEHQWVKNPNRISSEYIKGIHEFMEVAKKKLDSDGLVLCPCNACINARWQNLKGIRTHLLSMELIVHIHDGYITARMKIFRILVRI